MTEFDILKGKVITKIDGAELGSEEIYFHFDDKILKLYHSQNCCESVVVDDINGDIKDLLNTSILDAREEINDENQKIKCDSCTWTWTFYHLATIKGHVVIKWYGESNGHYSESVDIELLEKN